MYGSPIAIAVKPAAAVSRSARPVVTPSPTYQCPADGPSNMPAMPTTPIAVWTGVASDPSPGAEMAASATGTETEATVTRYADARLFFVGTSGGSTSLTYCGSSVRAGVSPGAWAYAVLQR